MNNEQKIIINRLKEIRKSRGLTQWQVANHLGFKSIDRISKWEHGRQYPNVPNLIELAKLFGVHAEELY